MTSKLTAFVAALALSAAAHADLGIPSGKYADDPTHAYITISYSHLGFSVPRIGFTDFDVDVNLDAANPENSTLDVEIRVAGVDSRVPVFDEHLVGENWFDVANHPLITYKATDIEMTGDNTAKITGDLTVKGITKSVVLDATINGAGKHPMRPIQVLGLDAKGHLKRSDFGLGNYAPAVGDDITIDISLELHGQ